MQILDTNPDHIPTIDMWDIEQMELLTLALDALSIMARLGDADNTDSFGIDF